MCQPCCQTPRPSQFKHHQPSLTPFTYTQAIANRLPDYTYSVPGMLFYFLDPGHTAGGFRLHERCYFDKKDLEVDMQGKVRAAVVVLCMCSAGCGPDSINNSNPTRPFLCCDPTTPADSPLHSNPTRPGTTTVRAGGRRECGHRAERGAEPRAARGDGAHFVPLPGEGRAGREGHPGGLLIGFRVGKVLVFGGVGGG